MASVTPANDHGTRPRRERLRLRILWAAALTWLGVLACLLALFRFVGETSWAVVPLMYLPRHAWILPGLLMLPPALRTGRRAAIWPLTVGALVWLFPLMGFVLPGLAPRPPGPTLRVLSYNTLHAADGAERLRALILEARPDLVLLQWTSRVAEEAMSGPGFEGWMVRRVGQFTVASQFPILSIEAIGAPADFPPAAHAIVDTSIGRMDVYNIRPKSAREELGATRRRGMVQRLRELVQEKRSGRLGEMASFREAQTRTIIEEAGRARHLVLIAGDTNLPGGSLFAHRYFGGFQDAFEEAGLGFGFTHPARIPWLRLDRVLLGRGLEAVSFRVLPQGASSHRAVVAEIARSPSP